LLSSNNLKLCDFGMTRKWRDSQGNPIRLRGGFGTDGYRCPEAQTGSDFDGRFADVWSAGVVFFIMLTGVPPFESADSSIRSFELITKNVAGIRQVLDKWGKSFVSPAAIDLLACMLSSEKKRLLPEALLQHAFFTSSPKSATSSPCSEMSVLLESKNSSMSSLSLESYSSKFSDLSMASSTEMPVISGIDAQMAAFVDVAVQFSTVTTSVSVRSRTPLSEECESPLKKARTMMQQPVVVNLSN